MNTSCLRHIILIEDYFRGTSYLTKSFKNFYRAYFWKKHVSMQSEANEVLFIPHNFCLKLVFIYLMDKIETITKF